MIAIYDNRTNNYKNRSRANRITHDAHTNTHTFPPFSLSLSLSISISTCNRPPSIARRSADDEDEVDHDVEEGLAEDHQHDERHAQQTARELRAQSGAAQLAAQHKRVPEAKRERT